MRRLSRHRLTALAAVVALLVGGAVAAVTATGAGRSRAHSHGARHAHRALDVSSAAAYLGISVTQLEAQLRAGKSLAQVAAATPGKSVSGLTQALIAQKRDRLDLKLAHLPKRVNAEVNRGGGPGARVRVSGPRRLGRGQSLLRLAAAYLGSSPPRVRHELRAGKTLAELAEATPGRSSAGLIATLVSARRAAVERALSGGHIARARADALLARIAVRVSARVNHRRAKR